MSHSGNSWCLKFTFFSRFPFLCIFSSWGSKTEQLLLPFGFLYLTEIVNTTEDVLI